MVRQQSAIMSASKPDATRLNISDREAGRPREVIGLARVGHLMQRIELASHRLSSFNSYKVLLGEEEGFSADALLQQMPGDCGLFNARAASDSSGKN